MGIKPELAGQKFSLDPFEVERGKIREFAAATGDNNPIYTDRTAAQAVGYADTPLPPTFGTVAGFWAQDETKQIEELGLPIAGMLHGEEEYFYLAPIYPGDILTGERKIASIIERTGKSGSMQIVTLETLYTNRQGQEVLKSRTIIVLPENMPEGKRTDG
jgi:acyl dehydratase